MSAHATTEQLEALIRGELTVQQSAAIESHVAGCARCQQELGWLRAERSLFERRPRERLPADLWQGIDARLPSQPPGLVAVPMSGPGADARRGRERVQKWFAMAAAAALLIGFSVGGFPLAGLRQKLLLKVQGASFTNDTSGSKSTDSDDGDTDQPERSASLKVSGPVLLKIRTAAADVVAVTGEREQIRAIVSETKLGAVELRTEASGDVSVLFDQRDALPKGHVRLELPAGSRLEVITASGDVSIQDVGGDAQVRTASGEVTVRGGRKLDIQTASGEISVDQFTGEGRIHSVSGDAQVNASAPLRQLDFGSTSGEISLDGSCAAGCRVTVQTVSGDVQLHTRGERSYSLQFRSQSGDLSGAKINEQDDEHHDVPREHTVKFGAGAGTIQVTSVSGDLELNHD